MIECPKCSGTMKTTHTLAAGSQGSVHRVVCEACGATATSRTVIVALDPAAGEGAVAVAARLRRTQASGVHKISPFA